VKRLMVARSNRGLTMSRSVKTDSQAPKSMSGLKRYLKNNTGGTGVMMGLTAIPVALAFGVAFDTAMINREQTSFYQSVDNASLAVAANERIVAPLATGETWAQREAEMANYAQKFLNGNYDSVMDKKIKIGNMEKKVDTDIRVKVKLTDRKVTLNAELDVPTPFMSVFEPIFGYNRDFITLKADSTANLAMRPIEIAFVLDTTGSMASDMSALKTAANKFLSTLYADPSTTQKNMTSPFIRVSLVPFAAAVRLDTAAHEFNMNWIDTTGVNPLSKINFTDPTWHNYMAWGKLKSTATTPNPAMQWNGCVESRIALAPDGKNYITSDIAPGIANPHSLFPAYFNPDSASWYTGGSNNYPTNTSGSTTAGGTWNNQYIQANANYHQTTNQASLLAPSGSRRTGFDDSAIGNTAYSMASRWKNQAKYDGKAIAPESFTASGVNWNQNRGPWYNCTASAIVPITHQRSKIETGIAAMKASGNTNITEGLAWGVRTISPEAPFTLVEGASGIPGEAIAPYNGPKWQKIILLMSDGENFAGSGFTDTGTAYNSFGASTTPTTGSPSLNRYKTTNISNVPTTMNGYTSEMCTEAKSKGITIYAVGFRLDNPVLRNCATSSAHYKFASSQSELVTYFDGIGRDVLNKMVYISN
jgi:hypothetical protein